MAVVGDGLVDDPSTQVEPTTPAAVEPGPDRSTRLAFWGFAAWAAFAWVKLVFDFGQERWFHRDDWIFLSDWTVGDAFEPFGEHLTTFPLLVFRGMWHLFGLQFTPYLIVLVTMHVAVAALLRVVMRRAGVNPWIATAGAGSLLLFGMGEQNMQWIFQIGFVGAVLFGLIQLLLADHEGKIDRRDWLALGAGFLAVLSTGVGPIMVVAVGAATFIRRGWRAALFQTAPLAALWLAWYVVADPRSNVFGEPPFMEMVRWVREGILGTVDGVGQFDVASVALGVVLVVGLSLMVGSMPFATFRARAATSLGLLLCGPTFFILTSRERWIFGSPMARSGRYLYLGAVFLLPALALAGDALARRWRYATPVVAALFLVGIPRNYDQFGRIPPWGPPFFESQESHLLALPYVPEAEEVPGWIRPEPSGYNGYGLTVDWLLEARDDGLVPEPDEIPPAVRNGVLLRLGLAQDPIAMEGGTCETLTEPLDLHLEQGDQFRIATSVRVAMLDEDRQEIPNTVVLRVEDNLYPTPTTMGTATISMQLPEMDVRLSPDWNATNFGICR